MSARVMDKAVSVSQSCKGVPRKMEMPKKPTGNEQRQTRREAMCAVTSNVIGKKLPKSSGGHSLHNPHQMLEFEAAVFNACPTESHSCFEKSIFYPIPLFGMKIFTLCY